MKKLFELCKGIEIKDNNLSENYTIRGVAVNSLSIGEDFLFFVTEGNEKYIDDAIKRGAKVLVAEKSYPEYRYVVVDDVRKSMAIICSNFFDNPQNKLKIVGVVGTNGKTSITHLLKNIFIATSKTATIGTLGVYIGDVKIDDCLTTPDPTELFKYLAIFVERQVEYVFAEISAHGIYYKKFYGIKCDVCVFTNISQDHLDFFENMEKYANTKLGYFSSKNVKIAVVNADDNFSKTILNNEDICSVSYGIDNPSDVFAVEINQQKNLNFFLNVFDDVGYVNTQLVGKFNVYNLLAAIAVARILGLSTRYIIDRIKDIAPILGRLNTVCYNPRVIIDYAHTPDGLKSVLMTVKEFCKGKLIAVFGCGGNRDKTKRPIMARIGCENADVCIFTTDNPRYELPSSIIDDMLEGVKDFDNYLVIENRTDAINLAIKAAENNDCVVICGKGGENYIETQGRRLPYSDFDAVDKAKNFA